MHVADLEPNGSAHINTLCSRTSRTCGTCRDTELVLAPRRDIIRRIGHLGPALLSSCTYCVNVHFFCPLFAASTRRTIAERCQHGARNAQVRRRRAMLAVEMLHSLLLALALGSSVASWQRVPPRCSRLRQAVRLRMAAPPLPEEGQEIEVECLRIAYGGQGIARTDAGATVMLTRAVPGEKLRAVVTRRRRRHVEARTTSVLAAGPASVTPPWSSLFATCGGCQLQHMAYDAQLATKRQWVVDALARSPGGAALRVAALARAAAPTRSPAGARGGRCRGSHLVRTLPP